MITKVIMPAFFLLSIFLAAISAGLEPLAVVTGLVFGFLIGELFS